MFKSFLRYACAILLAQALLACSFNPNTFFGAAHYNPDDFPIADERERVLVSYMAKGLIESDERRELLGTLIELPEEGYTGNHMAQKSAAAGLGVDAAVGQHGSQLGTAVSVGLLAGEFLLNTFSSDDYDAVSQAFLPEVFNGKNPATSAEAKAVLRDYVTQKIVGIGKLLGWPIECLRCDEEWLVYEMKPIANSNYEYLPEHILITFKVNDLHRIWLSDEEKALLGFDAFWGTKIGNTFDLNLVFAPKVSDRPYYYEMVPDRIVQYVNYGTGARTKIGRDLLRLFYSEPYFVKGADKSLERYVIYNGKVYYPSWGRNGVFVRDQIDEENDLLRPSN